MRLCYISGSYPPMKDGVGDFAHHIAEILTDLPIADILFVLKKGVKAPEKHQNYLTDFSHYQLTEVKKRILNFKPDKVLIEYPCKGYGQNLMINLLPALIKLADPTIKIILNIHEYSNYTWKGKVRIAMMCLVSDSILVTDRKNFNKLSKLKKNVRDILPVPPQIPIVEKKTYLMTQKGLLFSFWGFVRPNKGLHLLLSAFFLYQKNNPHARLNLLTDLGDSTYEIQLKNYIKEYDLQDKISCSGFLADDKLSNALSESDVCILPFTDGVSDRRGTLKAAMAMGIPLISTKTKKEYSPQGLLDKKNILLCQPEVESILEAMHELENDELRKTIGQNALIWAKDQSWDKIKTIIKRILFA